MNVISNVRMAKSMYPYGMNMNGCKNVGIMHADVVDTDTNAIVYSGPIDLCRGKIEMMGV